MGLTAGARNHTPAVDLTYCSLLCIELAAGVQVVEVQDRVEHHEVAAFGFSSPDRIVREQHDVAAIKWDIDDCRMLSDVPTAIDKSRHQQVFVVGVSKN